MKSILLFLFFLLVGFGATFLIVNKKTSKDIIQPAKKAVIQSSKFSLEKAPSESLHGDITLLTGEVKWQSRIATEGAKITEKQQIQQGEALMTGDTGKISLAFPNMLFTLAKNSQLNIIQSLPTSMVLEQTKGSVDYQTNSTTPLSIRISPLLIESTNGTFSATYDEDEGTVTISVTEGSVTTAYNDSTNYSTVETTTKGQEFIFDSSSLSSRIKKL
jgi:hypothetical protein